MRDLLLPTRPRNYEERLYGDTRNHRSKPTPRHGLRPTRGYRPHLDVKSYRKTNIRAGGGREGAFRRLTLPLSCPRTVLNACFCFQDITRLLSLAAQSIALLSLPQTDGPEDEDLPKGAERSEKFVDVANEYFERLDVCRLDLCLSEVPPDRRNRRTFTSTSGPLSHTSSSRASLPQPSPRPHLDSYRLRWASGCHPQTRMVWREEIAGCRRRG